MKGVAMVMVVLAMVQLMVEPGQAAIPCSQVDAALAPCVPYLTGSGALAPACCDGVKNIKASATTTPDKRAACNCIKEAANHYANLKDNVARDLPTKCGVQMDIPVSRTINCDTIL